MIRLLKSVVLLVTVLAIVALTVTSLPAITGSNAEDEGSSQALSGTMLMAHMAASGVLVFGLPVFAIVWLPREIASQIASRLEITGFWLLILTGVITIATVWLCMLPVAETQTMHTLMIVHGYAGFAMAPATALLLWGLVSLRRKKRTRSSTPG